MAKYVFLLMMLVTCTSSIKPVILFECFMLTLNCCISKMFVSHKKGCIFFSSNVEKLLYFFLHVSQSTMISKQPSIFP